MTSVIPPLPNDPGDTPPHLMPSGNMTGAIARPMEGAVIHVRIPGRCQAAMVVNVTAEDPLSAVFTVDACVFVPPNKDKRDAWDKPNTRPGTFRWVNNAQHASPTEDQALTWHYVGRECLPEVVLRGTAG